MSQSVWGDQSEPASGDQSAQLASAGAGGVDDDSAATLEGGASSVHIDPPRGNRSAAVQTATDLARANGSASVQHSGAAGGEVSAALHFAEKGWESGADGWQGRRLTQRTPVPASPSPDEIMRMLQQVLSYPLFTHRRHTS